MLCSYTYRKNIWDCKYGFWKAHMKYKYGFINWHQHLSRFKCLKYLLGLLILMNIIKMSSIWVNNLVKLSTNTWFRSKCGCKLSQATFCKVHSAILTVHATTWPPHQDLTIIPVKYRAVNVTEIWVWRRSIFDSTSNRRISLVQSTL